ncbi:MAG: pesticidal protein Cry15Aa [Chloroflexi bacterium]|nr:pesticidal protein Cry15Aa [Chloroflexota bacterium]
MQTIKKYANRKLYHIDRKQYITLDGIAALVQAGEQVRVVDNESGDDITAHILAQVALQTRGDQGKLPTSVLTGLIRAGEGTLSGLQRSLWGALGGIGFANAEISRRLEYLRETGKLDDNEVQRLRKLLLDDNETPPSSGTALPSKSDVDRLHEQVDALAEVVEQILAQRKQ